MARPRILIAGIGGASLGTELLKSLRLANRYELYGCDVSALAFGHYDAGFQKTFVVSRADYADGVLKLCRSAPIDCIVAGGEEPLVLLNQRADALRDAGIHLAGNSRAVTEQFTDKQTTFEVLAQLGFGVPRTMVASAVGQLAGFPFPCVVKPATGSGGSSFVFLAGDQAEAGLYVDYLRQNGMKALVQEYLPDDEGEFTVGVLSLPGGRLVGSVAMKRMFHAKLSVLTKGKHGLISSGNSQGLIDDFPEVLRTAERIATAVGSEGPLNVQGRVRGGVFLPFEINPRFSASTYLRALAGVNEIDLYLRAVLLGEGVAAGPIRAGYYLRSFAEVFVPRDKVVS